MMVRETTIIMGNIKIARVDEKASVPTVDSQYKTLTTLSQVIIYNTNMVCHEPTNSTFSKIGKEDVKIQYKKMHMINKNIY